MEPIYEVDIHKIKANEKFSYKDTLVREIRFKIFVNSKLIGSIMTTPIDTKELAIGYLISENVIENLHDIYDINFSDDEMGIEIKAKINENNANKLNTQGVIISGCGRSLSVNVEPDEIKAKYITNNFSIKASFLLSQMANFYTQCPLYEQTGCVHTAKLFIDENTFFIGEDIAQHNTIDKAVGKAIIANANLSKSFLMVSGRLSSEMVAKAVMHQIPILVSRTATTCLGYMIARKFNLTLCGFARGDKLNVYNADSRILI